MEELEKDGDRPINYSDFYDAILIVIQRNLAEQIQIVTKREKGLRQSIILQWVDDQFFMDNLTDQHYGQFW